MPATVTSGDRDPRARAGDDPPEPRPSAFRVGVAGPVVPDLIVADRRWHALVPGSGRLVARAARLGGGAGSVLLTTDPVVRRLNVRHRGQNHATNVLTFEAAPGAVGGDIVLALGVVRREAKAAGRHAAHHLAHLVLHGALHLRGHDHHGAGAARRMELREAWLLHRMRVPNPWRMGGAVAEAMGSRAGGSRAGGSRAGVGGAAAMRGGARRPMQGADGAGLGGVPPRRTKPRGPVLRGGTNRAGGRNRVLPGETR